MNSQATSSGSAALDWIKWVLAVSISVAAIAGNFYYGNESLLVRTLGVLVLAALAVAIVATTNKGRAINRLRKEAWVEMRKVVWPTRQETLQTTAVVTVIVLLVAIILWGIDALLGLLVSQVIG